MRYPRVTKVFAHRLVPGPAAWMVRLITRPARSAELVAPPTLPVRAVNIASRSGNVIRGWLLEGTVGAGAVLLLHGVGGNRESMVGRAHFLHRAGYTILLPDFQAHGESAGSRITFGALESLDAEAALAFLRACCGGDRIGVIGISMGGAAALPGAGHGRADAYVLESVYPTMRQAVDGRLRTWLGPLGAIRRLIAPRIMRSLEAVAGVAEDALRPIDVIGSLQAPVLVIAGSHDPYTPRDESRALFERAREPKEYWVVAGARHEDMHAFAGEVYERRVEEFLALHLRNPPVHFRAGGAHQPPSVR
jgi:pimeloyl-ACP methyl ester carboxylesterase